LRCCCPATGRRNPGLELLGAAAQALASASAGSCPSAALFDEWARATQIEIELGSYSKST
jgi:hypothetical protein